MRKILSIVLALSMALSLVSGVAFASTEETTTGAESRVYSFGSKYITKNATTWDIADPEKVAEGKEMNASTILPLKGFGSHGYYYLDADDVTFDGIFGDWTEEDQTKRSNAEKNNRTLWIDAAYLRIFSYNTNTTAISHPTGAKLALALQKPCTVPSFYSVTLGLSTSGNSATAAKVYMDYLDATEATRNVDNYTIPENQIGTTYNLSTAQREGSQALSELIYSNGTDDFSISFFANGKDKNLQLTGITLEPVPVKSIALSKEVIALEKEDDEAKVSVTATLDNRTTMGVVDSFVKYESSNPTVATVADDGTVTAEGPGAATITASVGGKTAEAKVTVGAKVYEFNREKANAANEKTDFPFVTNYTALTDAQPWTYFDIDNDAAAKNNPYIAMLQDEPYRLRMLLARSGQDYDFINTGVKLAFEFKAPDAGLYTVSGDIWTEYSGLTDVSWYMAKNAYTGEGDKDVSHYMNPEMLLAARVSGNYNITGNKGAVYKKETGKVISSYGNENLIFTIDTGTGTETKKQFALANITLTPVNVDEIKLSATKTSLDIGEETALTVTAGDYDVVDSFVTYTVDETGDVIDVAPDGTVTAKGAGTATITATVGGLTDTVGITVSEAYSAPAEIYYGEYNNVDNTADVKKAAPGTELTFTADEIDGYTFRYWVLGSAATGRYYSSEKTVEVTPYANIALTAIYTPVEENPEAIVELFNWNGAFIEALKASEIQTALGAVQPEMVGYGFANQWKISDEMYLTADSIITEDTRAMAVFNKVGTYEAEVSPSGTSENGWTRNGELVTYDEDYTFLTWLNEVGTIERNAEKITDKIPLAVLEKNDGTGAYMLEYDKGEYEIVEAGILFGSTEKPIVSSAYSKAKVKNIKPHGQFTVKPEGRTENMEAFARGYVMYKDKNDSNKIKVIYTK